MVVVAQLLTHRRWATPPPLAPRPQARGSILYLLKERGLATGLTAGVSDGGEENSSAAAMFQVSISLSEVRTCAALHLVVPR